jgi:hypothetical protein
MEFEIIMITISKVVIEATQEKKTERQGET